jgi:hypothetical protein
MCKRHNAELEKMQKEILSKKKSEEGDILIRAKIEILLHELEDLFEFVNSLAPCEEED